MRFFTIFGMIVIASWLADTLWAASLAWREMPLSQCAPASSHYIYALLGGSAA
jgi:hypothetical protein